MAVAIKHMQDDFDALDEIISKKPADVAKQLSDALDDIKEKLKEVVILINASTPAAAQEKFRDALKELEDLFEDVMNKAEAEQLDLENAVNLLGKIFSLSLEPLIVKAKKAFRAGYDEIAKILKEKKEKEPSLEPGIIDHILQQLKDVIRDLEKLLDEAKDDLKKVMELKLNAWASLQIVRKLLKECKDDDAFKKFKEDVVPKYRKAQEEYQKALKKIDEAKKKIDEIKKKIQRYVKENKLDKDNAALLKPQLDDILKLFIAPFEHYVFTCIEDLKEFMEELKEKLVDQGKIDPNFATDLNKTLSDINTELKDLINLLIQGKFKDVYDKLKEEFNKKLEDLRERIINAIAKGLISPMHALILLTTIDIILDMLEPLKIKEPPEKLEECRLDIIPFAHNKRPIPDKVSEHGGMKDEGDNIIIMFRMFSQVHESCPVTMTIREIERIRTAVRGIWPQGIFPKKVPQGRFACDGVTIHQVVWYMFSVYLPEMSYAKFEIELECPHDKDSIIVEVFPKRSDCVLYDNWVNALEKLWDAQKARELGYKPAEIYSIYYPFVEYCRLKTLELLRRCHSDYTTYTKYFGDPNWMIKVVMYLSSFIWPARVLSGFTYSNDPNIRNLQIRSETEQTEWERWRKTVDKMNLLEGLLQVYAPPRPGVTISYPPHEKLPEELLYHYKAVRVFLKLEALIRMGIGPHHKDLVEAIILAGDDECGKTSLEKVVDLMREKGVEWALESFSGAEIKAENHPKPREKFKSERGYVKHLFKFIKYLKEIGQLNGFKQWLINGADRDEWTTYVKKISIWDLLRDWFTFGEVAIFQKIVYPYCKDLVNNFGDPFDLYEESIKKRIKAAQQRGWKGGTNPEIEKWLGE